MRASSLVLTILMLIAIPLRAQDLSVTSVSPVQNAVSVPLEATIEFRLSDPLPDRGTQFSEKVHWSPRDSLTVGRYGHALDETEAIRIIFYEVQHRPDTDYTFILHGIRAASGDILERPFVLNYTTASSAGNGSVSGLISASDGIIGSSLAGENPGGGTVGRSAPAAGLDQTVVLLLREYGLVEGVWDVARAAVAAADGSYLIENVRPGTYWPLAVDFGDGVAGGPPHFGVLDLNGDLEPDSLVISGGGASGVDFTLRPYVPMTARDLFEAATTSMGNLTTDHVLTGMVAGGGASGHFVLPGGVANQWTYTFCSHTDDLLVDVDVTSVDAIAYWEEIDADTTDACLRQPIVESFVDSEDVLSVADAFAGSTFRSSYPDDDVLVLMSAGDMPLPVRPPLGEVYWAVQYLSPPGFPFEETTAFVDVESGEILSGFPVQTQPRQAGVRGRAELTQNYPNPFKASTNIEFEIEHPGRVRIDVFDLQGRRVATLVDEHRTSGRHATTWYAGSSPAGVYWYRVEAGGAVHVRSMVLLK